MTVADPRLLEQVPMLAGLPAAAMRTLAEASEELTIGAGEWLFREGEQADGLYVVSSGRFEVVDEGPPETLLRVLRRGEVLGELALLRDEPRSASVRAQRDGRLLRIGAGAFEQMIASSPGFALGLTRAIGERLALGTSNGTGRTEALTVAVLPLEPSPLAARAIDALEAELRRHGSLERFDRAPGDDAATAAALDAAERAFDRVLLVGSERGSDDPWSALCLREADRVVALTGGSPDADWEHAVRALHGCELVVLGTGLEPAVASSLRPRSLEAIVSSGDIEARVGALARRLCGRAVGVVLSGGGARAFAHIGAIEELLAAGVRIDRIAGVSLGSIVAATVARGMAMEEVRQAFETNFVEQHPTNDYALPLYSLIRGRKTRRLLAEVFGEDRIEELPKRFWCLSCDLIAREIVAHDRGLLRDAIYPSLAIPGVFPPVRTPDGRLLVDGGVLNNLPVARMAESGEGPVVAVDVTGRAHGIGDGVKRPALDRVTRGVRRYLTGNAAQVPRLGEIVVRSVVVGSADTASAAREHADLLIAPDVDGIGLVDWKSLPQVVERGRRAAAEALASGPHALVA